MKRSRSPAPSVGATRGGSARRRAPSAGLLADALRGLNEGVLIAESQLGASGLKIAFVNAAFCRITGYEVEELVGRRHGFLHHSPDDLAALRRWHRGSRVDQPLTGEGYLHHKNGLRLYASWSFRLIVDRQGRRTHIAGAYRDLTEKRRLQEELTHSQRLDAVGRLAGGVAHDFNNLLSVINGYCEILTDTVGDHPKARREIATIHQAGQRANTLVRQLLAFGRRQSIDPRVLNLNRIIGDNAEILSRLLSPQRSLRLSLAEDLPNLRADETQLQQVLLNLTINARDALPPGGLVTISTAVREVKPRRPAADLPPGRYVVLAVTDNGSGMDGETQAHLFEPFFTTKGEGKGTGLGLALVYGVVQQSGGYIFVHSAPQIGSTFEIFLPAVPEPADECQDSLFPLPITQGRETILLTEEDAVVRKMVAGILTADGYRVIAAGTPSEALAEARKAAAPIHLVAVDQGASLPESARLVRTLHQAHPDLRVIWTGSSEPPPVPPLPTDSHLVLAKPFALASLLRAVRRLLDGVRTTR